MTKVIKGINKISKASGGQKNTIAEIFILGVTPGSQTFSIPGTFQFTVPAYSSLSATINGAGGGSGGLNGTTVRAGNGSAGGLSQLSSATPLIANGGGGGQGGARLQGPDGTPGADGTASGGDTNITGGGSPGGPGQTFGSGGQSGKGGAGGQAIKTWNVNDPGAPVIGTQITVIIGQGGQGGTGNLAGVAGQDGLGVISWS